MTSKRSVVDFSPLRCRYSQVLSLAFALTLGFTPALFAQQDSLDDMLSKRSLKTQTQGEDQAQTPPAAPGATRSQAPAHRQPQQAQNPAPTLGSAPIQNAPLPQSANPYGRQPGPQIQSQPGPFSMPMPGPFLGMDPFANGDPFAEMERMHQEMEMQMQDMLGQLQQGMPNMTVMSMNLASQVQDEGDKYVVELQGISLKDSKVDAKVDGRTLKLDIKQEIRSQKQDSRQGNSEEHRTSSMHQMLTLPGPADASTPAEIEQKGDALRIAVRKAKGASPTPKATPAAPSRGLRRILQSNAPGNEV